MHTHLKQTLHIVSCAIYPLIAAVNLWVLFLAFRAAGIPLSPARWWLSWCTVYLFLSSVRNLPTRFHQLIGTVRTYAFSLHLILAYASACTLILLICLPGIWDSGARTAGFLALGLFFIALLTAVCGSIRAKKLHLHLYSMKTDKCLPGGTLSIVHLSDIHLGYIQNERFVRMLVRRVNALSPDLICITGDTFSDTLRDVCAPWSIAEQLARLHARYGVYACLGNHDTGEPEKMLAFLQKANIRVLTDEALFPAPNIALIGRADATPGGIRMRRATIGECMVGTDPLQYRIVLDHQPRDISAIAERGADLFLTGHTHGGQFYPAVYAVRRRFRCYKGEYRRGRLHVIVSTGSGAGSPPIRIGTKGEIVYITVRQTPQPD